MAKFSVTMDNELVKQLERLENFDELAKQILTDSSQPLESALSRELSEHKDTEALIKSVKKVVKKSKYGWFLMVRPTGKDKKGVRNMEKLAYIEFGTSRQAPRPLLSRAMSRAESAVKELMQRNFDDYVNKR